MKRILVVVGALLVGCGNSGGNGNGDGGGDGGGGNCVHVAVCDILPLATVKMACGTMSASTTTMMADGAELTNDNCKYIAPAGGSDVVAGRLCFTTAGGAQKYYNDLHDRMPDPGETRTEVTGVGDKAYAANKNNVEVDLRAIKGTVVVEFLHLSVATGQAMMAQQCLTTLATTLIAK